MITSESDVMISEIMSENLDLFNNFLSIEKILSMDSDNITRIFNNQELLLRIFLVFDPFSQENLRKEKKTHILRNKIVEKMFISFASAEDKALSAKYPNFICFKTEFALHFFYAKFRKSKNVRVLQSLRLLLIWTMRRFDK